MSYLLKNKQDNKTIFTMHSTTISTKLTWSSSAVETSSPVMASILWFNFMIVGWSPSFSQALLQKKKRIDSLLLYVIIRSPFTQWTINLKKTTYSTSTMTKAHSMPDFFLGVFCIIQLSEQFNVLFILKPMTWTKN